MLKVGVLAGGGGTNLQAIIDAVSSGVITNTELTFVLSNNSDAYALTRAKNANIKQIVVDNKTFESRDEFNKALIEAIDNEGVDLIVLAGMMLMMPVELVKKYKNRIINIHPSLIPAFCGHGYYGLHVHEKVLEKGAKVSGATVHFVDEIYDNGPIILQKAVDVLPGDTPEVLQKRIMQEAEWKILPKAIDLIANGKIKIENNIVTVTE